MAVICVKTPNGSYDITLGAGALSTADKVLNLNRRVLVVTDDGVPSEYARAVAGKCLSPTLVTIPQGEKSKSFENLRLLLSAMLENGFTRGDCVVAVGGGVVGDLCGFAASCYMRGIDFYNIPTTLLSQVDSSIGGKTAIDFEGVKNVVGAFYQPKAVLIDTDTLKTLDERQLRAGLAEAVKMAITSDALLFELIENADDFVPLLEKIVENSLLIKKSVVEKDPTEKGLRKVLNFGHTVGHAIEACARGALLHGECVAAGIPAMCSPKIRERVVKVLQKHGLYTGKNYDSAELLPYILHDKKMGAKTVCAIFADEIGSFKMVDVNPQDIFDWADKNL